MKTSIKGRRHVSQPGVTLVGTNVLHTQFLSSEKCTHESWSLPNSAQLSKNNWRQLGVNCLPVICSSLVGIIESPGLFVVFHLFHLCFLKNCSKCSGYLLQYNNNIFQWNTKLKNGIPLLVEVLFHVTLMLQKTSELATILGGVHSNLFLVSLKMSDKTDFFENGINWKGSKLVFHLCKLLKTWISEAWYEILLGVTFS